MREIVGTVRVVPFDALGGGPELWDEWVCWRLVDDAGLLALVRSEKGEPHRRTADAIAEALNALGATAHADSD